MRPSADPNPDMPALVGIEGRTVTIDGAGREDATSGDEERATLGLRVFRLNKGRDKLSGEVFRYVHGEDDRLALARSAFGIGLLRIGGGTEDRCHADDGSEARQGRGERT